MKLNCDLGEFQENNDAEIMPLIDFANIACGFHGSDPLTICKTIKLAVTHKVTIGAHPSYPDKENFGRQSMQLSAEQLIATLQYQIGALQALCSLEQANVSYVKPHGALYNDMMKDLTIFGHICSAIAAINNQQQQHNSAALPLSLMIQAITDIHKYQEIAQKHNINLLFEAFADRAYQDNGLLVARKEKNAVLENNDEAVTRCNAILSGKPLRSINNHELNLKVDTLCVHGDTPNALAMVKALRNTIDNRTSIRD